MRGHFQRETLWMVAIPACSLGLGLLSVLFVADPLVGIGLLLLAAVAAIDIYLDVFYRRLGQVVLRGVTRGRFPPAAPSQAQVFLTAATGFLAVVGFLLAIWVGAWFFRS